MCIRDRIKGLGGFHLAVDATNAAAVAELRRRKRRFEKPLAVMVPDMRRAEELCVVHPQDRRSLESVERPIVLMRARAERRLAEAIAPGSPELGVFLPYTPVQHLIFAHGGFAALVMTSANLSDEPICIDNDEATERPVSYTHLCCWVRCRATRWVQEPRLWAR